MNNKNISCSFYSNPLQANHNHLEHELIYVLEGAIDLTVDTKTYNLPAETFYLINTGFSHKIHPTNDTLIGCIHIPFEVISEYFPDKEIFFLCDSSSMSLNSIDALRKIICKIFTYNLHPENDGKILYDLSCTQLLYFLSSTCLAPQSSSIRRLPTDEFDKRAFELVKYIGENYAYDLNLNDMARHFHLSVPYLSKYFKDYFGITFLSYLRNVRLEHALHDLLYTNKTITQISVDNGFPNINSFTNYFKQTYQMNPKEYRIKNMIPMENDVRDNDTDQENTSILRSKVETSLQGMESLDHSDQFYSIEELSIDHNLEGQEFIKPYNKLICIGNSISLLRYDIREQLRYLHKELDFEYAYINNLLHPSMKIKFDKEYGNYNFSEVRKVLDYIVSLGMHPYIELEAQEAVADIFEKEDLLTATIKSNIDKLYLNKTLFDSFLTFLQNRYGSEELSKWYFSLERSTANQNHVDEDEYIHYFEIIYKKIKKKIPKASIGGPGFTIDFTEDRLEEFMDKWMQPGIVPDFINLYVFPYVYSPDLFSAGSNVTSPNRDFMANAIAHVNNVLSRKGIFNCETHVTLWNSTISCHNILNDSCHKSSYIMRNALNTWNMCNVIGYWGAFDIEMNSDDDKQLLFGGTGLLSQNDLRKPAFHAYTFLNRLLPVFVRQSEHVLITKNNLGRYAICCHNYKHYNALYYQKKEESISISEASLLFEDQESLQIIIKISNLPEGVYWIKKRFVNKTNGNIQSSWLDLNQLSDINQYETNFLRAQSEPGLQYRKEASIDGTITIEETLLPHEIMLLEIEMDY